MTLLKVAISSVWTKKLLLSSYDGIIEKNPMAYEHRVY